jgi:hypothetical protein
VSFRDAAGELARDPKRPLSETEAFAALVAAYWRGAFGGGGASPSRVYTPERLPAPLPPEGSGLPEAVWAEPATLLRRAVYWAPAEYAGFIARFWYLGDGEPPIDLPRLRDDAERFRWLAALPLDRYPPVVLELLARLHISREVLEDWRQRPRGREKPFWAQAEAALLRRLDEEASPRRKPRSRTGWPTGSPLTGTVPRNRPAASTPATASRSIAGGAARSSSSRPHDT